MARTIPQGNSEEVKTQFAKEQSAVETAALAQKEAELNAAKTKSEEERIAKEALEGKTQEQKEQIEAAAKETARLEKAKAELEKGHHSIEDLTEDQILELAAKRGLSVSKKELSSEEKAHLEQMEEAENLKIAVENKWITPEQYQDYKNIISEDGGDLTKKEFTKSFKADNPKATKEEIDSAYNDYYFVAQTIKENITDEEGNEKEIEKQKWDERFVKWGEQRRNAKAGRLKTDAQSRLDFIKQNAQNVKSTQNKISELGKTTEKVIGEILPEKYPVSVKIGDKTYPLEINLGKDYKEQIHNYVLNQIGGIIVANDKHADKDLVKEQVDGFIRSNYSEKIFNAFGDIRHSEGLNEGKVGAVAPRRNENPPAGGEKLSDADKQLLSTIPETLKNTNLLNRGTKP